MVSANIDCKEVKLNWMRLMWWLNSHMNVEALICVIKEKWHSIHDFKVHHIHCGRNFFFYFFVSDLLFNKLHLNASCSVAKVEN